MMTIHKEGYTSIALTILFIFVLNALVHFYAPDMVALKWFVYVLSFLLFVIILQFFRNPLIRITPDEKYVLCPADGKVVVIEETEESEYFQDKRIQLSVFMSPVNVHVNRNPIAGVVKYFKYHPGKYLVAWHPKSSTENERTTIVIENKEGISVLFRQIAGAMARRIVWYVKEDDVVEQGQQFGFIKFGSRVDVFLPLGTKINVNIGDVVKGGRTVLAELTIPEESETELLEATDVVTKEEPIVETVPAVEETKPVTAVVETPAVLEAETPVEEITHEEVTEDTPSAEEASSTELEEKPETKPKKIEDEDGPGNTWA